MKHFDYLLLSSVLCCATVLLSAAMTKDRPFEEFIEYHELEQETKDSMERLERYEKEQEAVDDTEGSKINPCCFPRIWQSNVTGTEYSVSTFKNQASVTIKTVKGIIYVDGLRNRITEDLTFHTNGTEKRVIYFIEQGGTTNSATIYALYPATRQCHKNSDAKVYFNFFKCIPKDAVLQGSFRLGSDKSSVLLQSWAYNIKQTDSYPLTSFKGQMWIEPETCAMVSGTATEYPQVHTSPNLDTTSLQYDTTWYLSNFASHVRDQSVFSLPDYCGEGFGENKKLFKYSISCRWACT